MEGVPDHCDLWVRLAGPEPALAALASEIPDPFPGSAGNRNGGPAEVLREMSWAPERYLGEGAPVARSFGGVHHRTCRARRRFPIKSVREVRSVGSRSVSPPRCQTSGTCWNGSGWRVMTVRGDAPVVVGAASASGD